VPHGGPNGDDPEYGDGMRRLGVALIVAVVLPFGGALSSLAEPVSAQVQDLDGEPSEDPPGLGNIVGSPDPGPKPTDAGDRGGAAQLALAGVMLVGVGFIGFRISRSIRR